MTHFPLGDLDTDRVQEAREYNLLEVVNGIYRLTDKCRKHYDELTYVRYLRGEIESWQVKKTKPESKQSIVESILAM